MEREFQKELNRTSLTVRADESVGRSYETGMFLSCHVKGLLSCGVRHVDNETRFSYDISAKVSLTDFCAEREFRKEELQWILTGILRTPAEMEDYLLCTDHLCLEPKMIFLDREKKETYLLFVPFYGRDFRTSLREMTEFLLERIDREESEAVVFGYRFYRMVMEEDVRPEKMIAFLTGKPEHGTSRSEETGSGAFDVTEDFTEFSREESEEEESCGPEEPETAYGRRNSARPAGKGGWRAKLKLDRRTLFLIGGGLLAVLLLYTVLHLRILEEIEPEMIFGTAAAAAASGALLAFRLRRKKPAVPVREEKKQEESS